MPVLAHAIEDSTDIFGISGGGLEPPPRYATGCEHGNEYLESIKFNRIPLPAEDLQVCQEGPCCMMELISYLGNKYRVCPKSHEIYFFCHSPTDHSLF